MSKLASHRALNFKIIAVAIVIAVVIGVAAGAASARRTPKPVKPGAVTTFEECAAKYPVQQSYPQVCISPDGSFPDPTQR